MSRIKFILFWLGAFCITNLSFGQQATRPTQCDNPGGGILTGGAFSLNIEYGCLEFTNNSAAVRILNPQARNGAPLVGGNYIFNLRDGRDITSNVSTKSDTVVTTPGVYWVMQLGNTGGEIYVTCKSFEIIKPEQPDVKVSSCGTNLMTVTFLNTTKNKAHGKYRILWGDGDQDIIPGITPNSFPFSKSHTYLTPPTVKPQIVGIYTRGTGGSIDACSSEPYAFEFETNNKPRINELEGLTGGTSNKITMVEGSDGKEYILEQKTKTGTWTDTGKKITRNAGEASKTETVIGLNAATEYCFRLKTTDGCGNAILSNEVCTIVPKATVISSKNVKLDWTSPDPFVTNYSIAMLVSDGTSNNFSPPTPNSTTYLYDAMVCTLKYNFNITAFIGTTLTDRVVIKSPTIFVDPSQTPKFPAKEIAQVSIQNNSLIRVTVFEPVTKAANYIFYRAEGDLSKYEEVKRTDNNFYEDLSVEPDKQRYCYKVVHQDACGNSSEMSEAFCSIYLNSEKANVLNWTEYNATPTLSTPLPVTYYINTVDNNGNYGNVNSTFDTYQEVKYQIEQMLDDPANNGKATFSIRAIQQVQFIDINGNSTLGYLEANSNEYTFITPAQLFLPTAFSPNSDGFNEVFGAKGRFIAEFNLEVYDRWGNVIFESKDLNTGWNGTASDGVTPAPAGNYGFKAYGLDPAGQKFEKVGSVTLIR